MDHRNIGIANYHDSGQVATDSFSLLIFDFLIHPPPSLTFGIELF